MNIRARWIVAAVFFGFVACIHDAELAQRIAGGSLVLLFLAVGIWDASRPTRQRSEQQGEGR